ncbi:MAG TPA: hypothetical protein P5079_03330 [Elusimicrobiota bacterium]|nr:hypothetical protein [Elusimicrobiota bacterium]
MKKDARTPLFFRLFGVFLLGLLLGSRAGTLRAEDPQAAAPVSAAVENKEEDSLDVTVTGEAKDEIPVIKTPPALDIPFREVLTLSREGQTDAILDRPVEHMTFEQQVQLVELESRQTVSPLMVQLPKPPFFRIETPRDVSPARWELQVIDQNNQVVGSQQGTKFTGPFLEWDGFDDGRFGLRVGPSYNAVLTVTDDNEKKQRFFGDSVQLDALQYEEDGLLHVEFNNARLYERGSADFSTEMDPLLEAALDIMRRRVGTPFRVIVYEKPELSALAQKRLDTWKKFLQDNLVIGTDDITLVTMVPRERGPITAVMMLSQP